MKLIVDENLASRRLLRELASITDLEVLPPEVESSDDAVWARALAEGAAILTGNAKDFVPRARQCPDHRGLLIVVRKNDPNDMTATEIATAIEAILTRYPAGIESLTLVVNAFRARR